MFLPRRWTRQPSGVFVPPRELFGHPVLGSWTPDTLIDGNASGHGVTPWGRYVENNDGPTPSGSSYRLGAFPQLQGSEGYTGIFIVSPYLNYDDMAARTNDVAGMLHVLLDTGFAAMHTIGLARENVYADSRLTLVVSNIENGVVNSVMFTGFEFSHEPLIVIVGIYTDNVQAWWKRGGGEGSFSYYEEGSLPTPAAEELWLAAVPGVMVWPSEPLYGLSYLQGQLTDSEARAILHDPWMIARPSRRPVIYSFPSGGITIPTLSLPGVQDITATGARPKVTLTF